MKAFALTICAALTLAAAGPQEIVLRPDLPAGEEWFTPPADNPHRKSASEKWVRKVSRPVLEVYPASKPNGAAVVIAPGGGFTILAIEHEGREVARWLNERGVTAFVLRYRVGQSTPDENRKQGVDDGLLAMKTVRARAGEWKVDAERIGFIGFSAGAHVTMGVATRFDAASRPSFAIPIYGGLADGEYQVPAGAPPLFLAVAFDDRDRTLEYGMAAVRNWKKAGIPAELHIFRDGGHGFGMNHKGKSSDAWIELLERWLRTVGAISAS